MANRPFLSLAGGLAMLAALSAVAAARAAATDAPLSKEQADGIIFERQNIMEKLDEDGELLGEIAAGIKPADQLAAVTRSVADSAKATKAAFQARVPGGRAKPEIWDNWADYSKRLDDFERNAEQMAQLGAKGDLAGVTNILADALPCKECHDVYRGPKR